MTDLEKIKQQVEQAAQDAITLDYSKWSFRQRQAKLSDNHDLWQQERDRTLVRQQSENAELRRKYLDGLEQQRKAKQAETDAAIELDLAPEKRRLQNEWLANNPNETVADFEKKAWHLLKENLIEQRKTEAMNAEIQSQLSSGRYSL